MMIQLNDRNFGGDGEFRLEMEIESKEVQADGHDHIMLG